jgi:hypothetical protein
MSERFGISDHAPQHAPDHALQNPTGSTPFSNLGGVAESWPTAGAGGGGAGAYVPTGPYVRSKRLTPLAIFLALVLGPLGLFYLGFLNGIAALFILPPVVRTVAMQLALISGAGPDAIIKFAVPVLWCLAVPWAIIGVKIRNARIDRAARMRS